MIALRTFALDQQQAHFRRDAAMLRQGQALLKELDGRLRQVADEWLAEMVQHDRLDFALWLRWQRSFVNALHRVIKDQYAQIGKVATAFQRQGFLAMRDGLVSLLTTLYPAEVLKTETPVSSTQSLDFKEMPFSLTIPDRELQRIAQEAIATCSHCTEDMVAVLTWASLAVWQEHGLTTAHLTEADPVTISIGRGKLAPEFLRFLRDQVDADLDPGKLITSLSTDHLKFVQGALLGAMQKGADLGWTKDAIMKHLSTSWETDDPRQGQAYNVLRILRTSHNRAANASVAYFAARNPVVAEMERVADGRPCAACCRKGTEILMANGDMRAIETIQVGEMVVTHRRRFCRVQAVMKRWYEGRVWDDGHNTRMVVFSCGTIDDCAMLSRENGAPINEPLHCLQVTPEHPVLTLRGWIAASELTEQDSVAVIFPRELAQLGRQYYLNGWIDVDVCNTDDTVDGNVLVYLPVDLCERRVYFQEVYNLDVEEDHSYVADFIAVHNCLPPGQSIYIGDDTEGQPQYRCIEELQVGDLVMTHLRRLCLVTQTFRRWYRGEVVTIHDVNGHQLRVTPEHPILTAQGWQLAGQLQVGELVEIQHWVAGQNHAKVIRLERTSYAGWVYNLEVERDNSYVAGGIVCHNCCVGGTTITTEVGSQTIEEIQVGSQVMTHRRRMQKVIAVMQRDIAEEIVVIRVRGKVLRITKEHPVLTPRGWVPAGQLTMEDRIGMIEE